MKSWSKTFSLPFVVGMFWLGLLFSSRSIFAAETDNRFGLNVAARANHVDFELANYVKQDGWIVVMPTAPVYTSEQADIVYNEIVNNYFNKLGSQVNYILRAHYPYASNPDFTDDPTFPDASDSSWAIKWADFWAGIINKLPIPAGSSFYVIPWNEPNLQRECSGIGNAYDSNDCGCANYVLDYITQLERKLDRGKVRLLTPAFAVSAPNFYSFAQCLGGANFFNRFDGVSLDYYDFETGCSAPFCNPDPMFNPNKYPELLSKIGAGGKRLFIVETGLVSPEGCAPGVPDCPNFTQPEITLMLCQLYNNHKDDPNLAMFSPLTYNPEKSEGDWFWDTNATRDFYIERGSDCSKYIEKTKKDILEDNWSTPVGKLVYGRRNCFSSGPLDSTIPSADDEYKQSCVWDWSPERPYVGNSTYEPLDEFLPGVINYCNPSPKIEDMVYFFTNPGSGYPKDSNELAKIEPLGEFNADWTTSQMPFLGNSRSSSTKIVDPIERRMKFLTDYLRGELFYDRGIIQFEGDGKMIIPEDKASIEEMTGVIKKLYPYEYLSNGDVYDKFVNDFVINRLLQNATGAKGPIHDYVLAYKGQYVGGDGCADGLAGFIPEEYFTYTMPDASPDRRRAKCYADNSIYPIRLSTAFCCNANWGQFAAEHNIDPSVCSNVPKDWLCGTDEWTLYAYLWHNGFPLFSKEDMPVVIDIGFDLQKLGGPPSQFKRVSGPFHTLDRQTQEFIVGSPKLGTWGENFYYYELPQANRYSVHRVDVVYVPYLAELYDLSDWLRAPITSSERSESSWSDMSIERLRLPTTADCNLANKARGGQGDSVAQDSRFFEPTTVERQMYLPRSLDERNQPSLVEHGCGASQSFTYDDGFDQYGNPITRTLTYDPCTAKLSDTGTITTRIPYLGEIAKRLIGQDRGVFRVFFTADQNEQIERAIVKYTNGKINPMELPGYGLADYYYTNLLATVSDRDRMWNKYVCDITGDQNACNQAKSGFATVNDDEAKFYFPYLGALNLYQRLVMEQRIPSDYYSPIGADRGRGITPPPAEGITDEDVLAFLAQTQLHRDTSVDVSSAKQRVIDFVTSWCAREGGCHLDKLLIADRWDDVYNNAVANGWNPAFVIALWIEESRASGWNAYDLGCSWSTAWNNLDESLRCLNSREYRTADFHEFMCRYADGHYPCTFIYHPYFVPNLKYFYDYITQ